MDKSLWLNIGPEVISRYFYLSQVNFMSLSFRHNTVQHLGFSQYNDVDDDGIKKIIVVQLMMWLSIHYFTARYKKVNFSTAFFSPLSWKD